MSPLKKWKRLLDIKWGEILHDPTPIYSSQNFLLSYFVFLLTSKRTLKTRSHNWSATSSLTVGGERRVSFIAKRNKSKTSQVPLSKILESCAICWSVLKTLWQNTACLCIVSNPKKHYYLQINSAFWRISESTICDY